MPFADSIEGLTGNLVETYIVPYFHQAYRPVTKGDIFRVTGNFRPVDFKVVDLEPGTYGIVDDKTVVFAEGDPINRDEDE